MEGSDSDESSKTICTKWSGVMEELKQFHALTVELVGLLSNMFKADREENINKISQLLDRREILMGSIHPPFSEKEKKVGRQLLQLNKQVDELLLSQKKEIQRDINELNAKKKSSNKYTNPYESFTIDGAFYDKKN